MTKIKTVEINNGNFIDSTKESENPQGKQLLVDVEAVSINPVDVKRMSLPKKNASKILGYDAYGTIIDLGDEVQNFKIGDKVFYSVTTIQDGSFQEQQLIDYRLVAIAPKNISAKEAVAFPLVSLTAYELLFEKMNFIPEKDANEGDSILIVNGAGGVGSAASQLAKWAGLEVWSTSSPSNFSWLQDHGVDHVVDYHDNVSNNLTKLADNSFDATAVFYDITTYFDESIRLVKPFGHIGTIVGLSAPIELGKLQKKSQSFDWELMFTKSRTNYHVDSQGQILSVISRLLDEEIIKPIRTKTYRGINARSLNLAANELRSGKTVGKITILKH